MSWRTFGMLTLAMTIGVTVGGVILGAAFLVALGR